MMGAAAYDVPRDDDHARELVSDWEWRIFGGHLYKIRLKEPDLDDDWMDPLDPANQDEAPSIGHNGSPDMIGAFIPNKAQRDFLNALHYRNIILKARQIGFSTLIEIMALDHAVWNANQSVLIVAQTLDVAKKLMRDKIKFAYFRLPEWVRLLCPLTINSVTTIEFANGSTIEVSSSGRSGTFQFIHVSEMGKISAERPAHAREIVTGSLQAASKSALVFIESTAEGMGGTFHDMSNDAKAKHDAGSMLSWADYKFHFFPWWQDPGYRMKPKAVVISSTDHAYFDRIEGEMDVSIDLDQRAWYVAKREADFRAVPHDMLREYPSTPDEAWQASTEGRYFAHVIATARKEGRIGTYPIIRHLPVNSFWDIGATDTTSVWLHQKVRNMDHFVRFREAAGEGYLPMILWMEQQEVLWGDHFLPHDGNNSIKGKESIVKPITMLREMKPQWSFRIVPQIDTIQNGIDLTRRDFATYCFDEAGTKEGLTHIEAYSREYNQRLDCWGNQPRHDEHSHAADALRQKAQGMPGGALTDLVSGPTNKKPKRRATGLTA
ncbi:hypothetical protein [uncultured Roseobacter sp.]|uniref:hypothetical protein n=1 Tax=uncultured Roseobacter sp. TaxID=114847 RepID=UPI00261A7E4A|nr:hypothetical protein [uncultured Roseobacter sp.]